MAHQRPPHGQHLLFAAGKGSGSLTAALLEPGETFIYPFQSRCNLAVGAGIGAHLQIFFHAHLRKNPAAFRHMGQPLGDDFMGNGCGNALVLKGDGAGFGAQKAGYGFQYRRFSGAVGADKRYNLSLFHRKRDVLDGMDAAVIDIDVFHLKHGHGYPSFLFPKYASMTAGFSWISSGVPLAMILP